MTRLTFYGAVRTTTGSMHLVEVNEHRILLDSGLFQGKRKDAFERNRTIPVDPASIEAIVLSHAHIDHSGNIPTLVRCGFRGWIHTTPATTDLCEVMLLDSAHIQAKDIMFVNKKRIRQGKNPFEVLYTEDDVTRALEHFDPLEYGESREILPGVRLTFYDAGHILGSALTVLEADGHRIVFTGDLGRPDSPILRDPSRVPTPDILITESTYGGRRHPSGANVKEQLKTLVNEIAEHRSRLVIPAFSVGRTQAIVFLLHQLSKEGTIPAVPVFVDSPLSSRATEVFLHHPECFDAETRGYLERGENPFSYDGVTYVADVEDSKALNDRDGPMIIISASGMCESGRILHHLQHSITDPDNVILIVGYQAENTLGRRIQDGADPVKIFGDPYPVRARVTTIDALSSHADDAELTSYIASVNHAIEKIFVVHGEEARSEALAAELPRLCAGDIVIPQPGESFEIP